jgi:hypothetical protein
MPEDDPVDVGVFELVRRDFTSEGTGGVGEAILSGDLGWRGELFLDGEEVEGWWGYYDFCWAKRSQAF